MKKFFIIVMLVTFTATVTFAADVVNYESKKGTVTFNHKAHAEKLGCKACHEGAPAKITINKDVAHKAACKDCHKKQDGPTKCNDCHKK